MVQRLCGICPVSHHLAACKALDAVGGAARVPASADKLRRLMHHGQVMQSHALHFFHLASPDLLFGFDADPARRHIVGVAQAYPEIAKKGIALRRYGQEVIRATAGKRIHGTGSVPGGVNRLLSDEDHALLLRDVAADARMGRGRGGAGQAAARRRCRAPPAFAVVPARHAVAGAAGRRRARALRRRDPRARRARPIVLDDQDPARYLDLIEERSSPGAG
jgi:NAD-reducing hydrogenase large subunit